MGRKRKQPGGEGGQEMRAEAETVPKQSGGSRHLDRHTIALRGIVYRQLKALAASQYRDAKKQAEMLIIQGLRDAGLWTEEMEQEYRESL